MSSGNQIRTLRSGQIDDDMAPAKDTAEGCRDLYSEPLGGFEQPLSSARDVVRKNPCCTQTRQRAVSMSVFHDLDLVLPH